MTVTSRVLSRLLALPRPSHRAIERQRDLPARMPDGAVLLANRWFPHGHDGTVPTVLMRSPYGRSGFWALEAPLLAERGFNVVVQSCRGTRGSGGEFEPFRNERADGLATLEWVTTQPWYDGRLATYGSSYCGYTQYAAAHDAPDGLIGAMAPSVAASDLRHLFYPYGVLALETLADWVYGLDPQGKRGLLDMVKAFRASGAARQRAAAALPLREADVACTGRPVPFFRDWVDHPDLADPYWSPVNQGRVVHRSGPPVTLHSGWYDIFTPWTIRDFVDLQAAGREVELTIGPWAHGGGYGHRVRNAVHLFDRTFGRESRPRAAKPVHLQLEGDKRWLHFPSWPPPSSGVRWHLQPGGALAQSVPRPSPSDSYLYDPADPTPSIGGASLNAGGSKDNAAREARADVLTFTSVPLGSDVVIAGTPTARLHVRSTTEHFDVVVRLCEVDGKGVSRNLSDGIVRVTGEADPAGVTLWPIGARLRKGHRIRVQVASALHPLFARNLGTGGPVGSASELVTSTQRVLHDPERPSWIELPVVALTEHDYLP